MPTPRQQCLLALAYFGILASLFAARVSGQTVDDFFITYHYAQNLVDGLGFVFNPGERVLATTAPGWGLLLALLHGISGISLPNLGTWMFAACLAAIATLCFVEGQRLGRGIEAWIGGTLLVSCSFLWPHNGFEYPAALLLLLLAAQGASRYPVLAGLSAAYAVWCRPDSGLLVAFLGLLLLIASGRGEGVRPTQVLRFALTAGSVIVLGLALATWYYGHPLPVTLEAKRAQSIWLMPGASGWGFWTSAYRWLSGTYAGPWTSILVGIGGAGLFRMLWQQSRSLRMLVASSLTVMIYPLLGVPFYTWYAIPLLIGLLYGYTFLAGDLVRWLLANQPSMASRASVLRKVTAGVCLLFLTGFPAYVSWRSIRGYQLFTGFPRCQLYREAGQWLASHAASGDRFAFVEVGTIAYYSRLPVWDLTGLVTPEARPFASSGDLTAAFAERPTPWLITADRLDNLMGPVLKSTAGTSVIESKSLQNRDGTLRIYRLEPPKQ